MSIFSYLISIFVLAFIYIVQVEAQICPTNPPSLIQNSLLVGACTNPYTASDQIVRDSSQINLTGINQLSISSWVKISSLASGNVYSLFRLTQDQATTTAINDQAIRLTMFIDRTGGSRKIQVQFSKTGVNSVTDNTSFAFLDDNWIFLFISYNLPTGFIYYNGWHPNLTPANDITFSTNIGGLAANFHSALTSAAKLELLYWGTNNKFCGSINRFVYYSSYSIASPNNEWMIQALTDGSKSAKNLLYLRLEYSDPLTQSITDFSNQASRNDAVLGLSSATEASDPSISLSSSNGLTLQTGQIVTVTDHKWDGQKGVTISFWIKYPAALTVNTDADTTETLVKDVVLLSKKTGSNIFRILTNGSNNIKIVINNQVYTGAKALAANAWSQVTVSLALYSDVSSYYNYYIFKIDYHDLTSSGYIKMYTNVIWDETTPNGITIGDILNNFTGNIQISQLKVESGLGVFFQSLGCAISNCKIAFAKFSTNKCILCLATYYEQNGNCFNTCDTSAFGLTNANIQTCSSCSATCTYCNGSVGSQTCTACATNYYLNSPNCVTAAGCSPNSANPNTGLCDPCGNSITAGAEQCDDGNFNDYDGCTNCQIDPGYTCNNATPPSKCVLACGNGVVNTNEECDDGNQIDSDGCSNCIVDSGYYCTGAGPSVCKSLCGNGAIDINEECDDGNNTPSDGCTNCLIDIGYSCTGAPSTCTSLCGNSKRESNEQCDNGNAVGCTSCTIDSGYKCSGGSSTSADVCSLLCFDGIKQDTEECDDNNGTNGDGCSSACKVESGWFCTNASPTSPSVCTQISAIPAPCGDGIKLSTEICDAGVNPGCNPTCTAVLPGYTCQGGSFTQPDTCTPICGDGKLLGSEECDDGNLLVGDGCDQNCKLELNYQCTSVSGALSVCTSLCGNGQLDSNEECDDENQNNGDGCNSECKIEIGYSCTQIVAGGRYSCFQCATNCLQCTSKSIKDCEVCFPSYYKNPATGQCDQNCSDGYYVDYENQICASCLDSNCKSCISDQKSSCIECQNDTFIAEGDCYKTCPYGFYPTLNPVLGNECTRCPYPCAACTQANDCQACSDLYYLDEETLTCKLCGMDPKCFSCDVKNNKCLKCAIGYKVNGSTCEQLPTVCGDGYFQPSTEKCDDGNTTDGDGCSSSCKIETNYGCILKTNEGPSICYEKRPTKVSGYQSKVDYSLIYIKFERELQNPPQNITQSDLLIKIAGLKSSNYNYTMKFIDSQTIKVRLNYTKTVHSLEANIDFSKSFKNKIQDIYNYTLTTKYEPFFVPLPYYIYYSDQEQTSAVAVSWVFVSLALILMGPLFAYLYQFGQGRVFKFIEVIQVIGLMRFFNIRFDIFSYQLFQQADLVYNLRGMYSVFQSIPISNDDETNFANKDNLTIQRQLMNSSFIHSIVGTIIMSYIILSLLQSINLLLYRFIEIDQVTQITEKIKEFMQWDAYIKLFDFIFYFISISIFLELQSFSFVTPLSIVNLVLCILSLLGVLALGYILMKKYVRYQKLHKRTDWFEKYPSLFDGLKFNLKRAKVYIIYPYINKFVYSGVIVLLHDMPFYQIVACAGVRAANIIVLLITKPFHFNFMQRRDIASELFLIVMIALCLNCTDDNSESNQKRIMAIIFVILPFLFIFAYSALYLWTVTQEDIYFDPINIVPLQANPEDWMSQQEDNSKEGSSKKGEDDEEAAEPPKKNQILPLNNSQEKSGQENQDDFNNPEKLIGQSEHNDEEEDDDIFAAHQNANTRNLTNLRGQNQNSGQSMGRNKQIVQEDEGMDDDESQQNEINNYQR